MYMPVIDFSLNTSKANVDLHGEMDKNPKRNWQIPLKIVIVLKGAFKVNQGL